VSRGNCPPRAETPRLGNYKNPVKTGCAVKNLLEPLAPFMGVGANKFSRGIYATVGSGGLRLKVGLRSVTNITSAFRLPPPASCLQTTVSCLTPLHPFSATLLPPAPNNLLKAAVASSMRPYSLILGRSRERMA
jgi:hypothetical protein